MVLVFKSDLSNALAAYQRIGVEKYKQLGWSQ